MYFSIFSFVGFTECGPSWVCASVDIGLWDFAVYIGKIYERQFKAEISCGFNLFLNINLFAVLSVIELFNVLSKEILVAHNRTFLLPQSTDL